MGFEMDFPGMTDGGSDLGFDMGMTPSVNQFKYKETNWKLIPLSLGGGLLSWLICRTLYGLLFDTIHRSLLIGIIFLLLSVILGIVLIIMGRSAGTNGDSNRTLLFTPLLCVLMLICGILFQFIYGFINPKHKVVGPTSYIFLIDNSGSMSDSDPGGKRYEAIEEILRDESSDFPFMIYGFSDGTYVMRKMSAKSNGWIKPEYEDDGGTSILGTLKTVLNDYEQKAWQGGNNPRVVLLTDGYATDIFWNFGVSDILKKYNKKNISISCVGLGDVDGDLLRQIADETNGIFIDIDDTAQLVFAMKSAATIFTENIRDLVSVRTDGYLDILFAILRILFLTLLGAILAVLKVVAYGDGVSAGKTFVVSMATSIVGAIVMEIGTAIGVSATPLWFALWLLYSLTIADRQSSTTNLIYGNS